MRSNAEKLILSAIPAYLVGSVISSLLMSFIDQPFLAFSGFSWILFIIIWILLYKFVKNGKVYFYLSVIFLIAFILIIFYELKIL